MKPHALYLDQQIKDEGGYRECKESIPQSVVDADSYDRAVYHNTILHNERLVVLQFKSVSLLPTSLLRSSSSYSLIHTASHDQASSMNPEANRKGLRVSRIIGWSNDVKLKLS